MSVPDVPCQPYATDTNNEPIKRANHPWKRGEPQAKTEARREQARMRLNGHG